MSTVNVKKKAGPLIRSARCIQPWGRLQSSQGENASLNIRAAQKAAEREPNAPNAAAELGLRRGARTPCSAGNRQWDCGPEFDRACGLQCVPVTRSLWCSSWLCLCAPSKLLVRYLTSRYVRKSKVLLVGLRVNDNFGTSQITPSW